MELLRAFCGFSLASCAALLMLPEGSLRKTASLAFGLMASLLWMDGLSKAELPEISVNAPETALVESGTAIDQEAAIVIAAEAMGINTDDAITDDAG